MSKKTTKKSGTAKYVYNTNNDPVITRVVYSIFIAVMLLAFAVNLTSVIFLSAANETNGFLTVGNQIYVSVDNEVKIFDKTTNYTTGSQVGYLKFDQNGKATVDVYNLNIVEGKYVISDSQGNVIDEDASAQNLLGKFSASSKSGIMKGFADGSSFTISSIAFIALAVIMGLLYFLVSPRGAKKFEKKEESEKKSASTVSVFSDNADALMRYISSDDNIEPMELGENEVTAKLNINYYNSVKLHKGEVYTVVKKYPQAVRNLEEYGAADMDIIKMNMIGNDEFDNLILLPHKEKTMSMQEIIDYVSSLDGVYCIKKRGILNWSFKYKSKTVIIVKQNDEGEGFKVSVKVYPDAATKLNVIYKALEDSSFPIGPFWYMFNNLRNLPANVIKWLINESLKISKWQQTRADFLRDTPSLDSMGVDKLGLHTAILSGTKALDMGKFTVITQIADNDSVKYDTVLKTGYDNLDVSEYTKEITMLVPNTKGLQFSILTKKSMGDALLTSLCNELQDFCTPLAEEATQNIATANAETAQSNPTQSTAKVVKRTTTKKK